MQDPDVRRYFEDWGRKGDISVVASEGITELGMAWSRLYPAEQRSYGFVAADVPEISIAVRRSVRGFGIGTRLLESLLEANHRAGFKRVSLAMRDGNPAIELYQRLGFQPVRSQDGIHTMTRAVSLSVPALG